MAILQRDAPISILPEYVSSASQSADFYSNPYPIQNFSCAAFQAIVTNANTLNCTIKLQVTLDKPANNNWDDYPSSTKTVTANSAPYWDLTKTGAMWARLAVTFTAGDAQFNMLAFSKI